MYDFTKIIPTAFVPFLGHYQGLLACVKSVFLKFFKVFRLEKKNYVNACNIIAEGFFLYYHFSLCISYLSVLLG